jgi:hypothetical protein
VDGDEDLDEGESAVVGAKSGGQHPFAIGSVLSQLDHCGHPSGRPLVSGNAKGGPEGPPFDTSQCWSYYQVALWPAGTDLTCSPVAATFVIMKSLPDFDRAVTT